MQFTLVTKPLSSTDVGPSCPYVPSGEDVAASLDSLFDEIANLTYVADVTREAFVFNIALSQPRELAELKLALERCFSDNLCQIRYVSLEPNDGSPAGA